VEQTWSWRDRPVLSEVVRFLDAETTSGLQPEVRDIAPAVGLSEDDVARALSALDGRFVTLRTPMGGHAGWFVSGVTSEARSAVGQWPSAEVMIGELADDLAAAADAEADPDRKRGLQQVTAALRGTAQSVVTDVLTRIIERSMGLG
jgi:hypothetical protein